ncbi:MAG: hypothetical protein H6971_05995 [Gammaproteobacteria bacterium]|nr:hypothetical protein [Gammaproteobacteria bacterium]
MPVYAQYQQEPDYQRPNNVNDVDISIIDDHGREFPQYPVHRDPRPDTYRAYLEAAEGKNYSIRVRNRSAQRIGLVIAVDGRNIISGDKSWLRSSERLYVLGPHQQATYDGWRTGKNWVNRFFFTEAGDSYAEAWNDRSAMGVIAVAVFREKVIEPPPRNNDYDRPYLQNRSQRAPGTAAEEAGTGFGEKDWSPTRKVDFEAEQSPSSRYFVKYEWRETLCREGVIRCDAPEPRRPHNRFWDDRDDRGYAPYPPNYRD